MFYFFLSYAREDANPYLRQFYEDLSEEVRALEGLDRDVTVGFFNGQEIEPGRFWDEAVAEALSSCRTFVCLLSRAYVNSVYTGKELEAFRRRLQASGQPTPPPADGQTPSPIIPVLWCSPESLAHLPAVLSRVQQTSEAFAGVYDEEGLYYLMKLNRYRDEYRDFVRHFAEVVVKSGRSQPLDAGSAALPSLSEVESAFHPRAGAESAEAAELSGSGPRFVNFVFVAGRRDEMTAVRRNVDAYGDYGGDWVPYRAAESMPAELYAQQCAAADGALCAALAADEHFTERLAEAKERNQLVIILVDAWTLRLEHYARLMREYDAHNFLNSVVLVIWDDDAETAHNRAALEMAVHHTFPRKSLDDTPYFRNNVGSPDALRKELSVALSKVRRRLAEQAKVYRHADAAVGLTKPSL